MNVITILILILIVFTIIILFLSVMVIVKTSKLRTLKEFSTKLEADYDILKLRYEKATEMMKELSLMMSKFQENVRNYKEETEKYIELLKQDTDYKKN